MIRSPTHFLSGRLWRNMSPTGLIQFPPLLSASRKEALREKARTMGERGREMICEALESMTSGASGLMLILEGPAWADLSTTRVSSRWAAVWVARNC